MKPVRAIQGFFLGCNHPMWSSTITHLMGKGVQFSYICGTEDALDQLTAGACIIKHDVREAERGIFPQNVTEAVLPILDEVILNEYQSTERVCLEIADRMDMGYSFSYQERTRLYLKMLAFWLYMVEHHKPRFVVFQQTPHSVDSFVLLGVCRKQNVPTLSFLPITVLELVLPIRDYALGLEKVLHIYNNYSEDNFQRAIDEMPQYLTQYLDNVCASYQKAIPPYLKERLRQKEHHQNRVRKFLNIKFWYQRLTKFQRYSEYWQTALQALESAYQRSVLYSSAVAPKNYLKRPGEPIEQSYLTGQEWRKYKIQAAKYKRHLSLIYESHCEEIDYDSDYIYVPLSFQPERTSVPEAGRFSNQILMIKMLSRFVPKDWKIVVKENPTQLLPGVGHGERGRYAYYYDDLISINNVVLAHLNAPQFELIDNSKAVATLTGTSGWEACVRGKPALIFGHAWYQGCEGVFYCGVNSQCENAIKKIKEGYQVNERKVYYFLYCLFKNGFRGHLNPKRFTDMNSGIRSNVEHLTRIIEIEINRLQ